MGTFTIKSKKYGIQQVFYDDEDCELVSSHTWCIQSNRIGGIMYAMTNTPRPNRKILLMHHLVKGTKTGEIVIDHINLNGLDNRKENLRLASKGQNSFNKRVKKDCKSGFKGVGLIVPKYGNPYYHVACCANGKRVYGGIFSNPIDAAKRYNELALKMHGEFANLNQV